MTIETKTGKTFLNARQDVWVYLFLCAAIFGIYQQVGGHRFVNFDDTYYVTENFRVQAGLTLENIVWAFTTTDTSNWHPLTWLSHMLDCHLFGLHAGMHHFVSLMLHMANSLLLFYVLKKMTGSRWRSCLVAALFALHPLHVESVAWISERKDVLSTLFWMLCLVQYMRYVERSGIVRYLLVLFLFALGLMAKPMVITLPFVLLLLDFWPFCRFQSGQEKNVPLSNKRSPVFWLVLEKSPLFIMAAAS